MGNRETPLASRRVGEVAMEMRELSVPEQTPLPRTPRSPLAAPPRDCGASQSGSQRCTPSGRMSSDYIHPFSCSNWRSFVHICQLLIRHGMSYRVDSVHLVSPISTSIRRLNAIFFTYPFHPLHRLSKSWRENLPGRHSSVRKYHPFILMFTALHWEDVHPYMPGFHPTWDVLVGSIPCI